jgi:hypothetical protein
MDILVYVRVENEREPDNMIDWAGVIFQDVAGFAAYVVYDVDEI